MPSGVAPLLVLEPEAAALAAVKILAVGNAALGERITAWRDDLRQRAEADDREMRRSGAD
jgi:phosphoribosylcarboxyaminoimidazole (NCAIR) mutase